MDTPDWPDLHPNIEVMESVDVPLLWEFFQFYEAGHHGMDIMNPLSSQQLDQVIDAAGVAEGHRVLDIASGHGELLLRLAGRAKIDGVGVDLSPWTTSRAARRIVDAGLTDRVRFRLGSGTDTAADPEWDLVCGLGMSWVWEGFEGTAAALARRTRPGGTVVFGDIYLRDSNAPTDDDPEFGPQLTLEQQQEALHALGLTNIREVRTRRQDWDRYDTEVHQSIMTWLETHPGHDDYLTRHQEWMDRRELLDKVGWTVWIGTKLD